MSDEKITPARVRWARLRFGIIAPLLSSPPAPGELGASIAALAARPWRHPSTGESVQFSAKTIERWLYTAREQQDPIRALERKVPSHAGTHPSITPAVAEAIRTLRRQHPRWSYQLVRDNLVALGREQPDLGPLPGYATVCRYMKHHGLGKHRKPRRHEREPGFVPRERRSFEVSHVHALWHCDFHNAKRKVLTASGERREAVLLGLLDDHSRVCCHAQWYVGDEDTESFVHGLCQGFQKRGLPRALLSDSVARHRIAVLCPSALCGRFRPDRGKTARDLQNRPHNLGSQSESSQPSRDASVRHGGLRAKPAASVGGAHFSMAAALVRRLISA